jgi:hypothetical protein
MYFVFGAVIKSIKFLAAPLFLSCSIKDVSDLFSANLITKSLLPSFEQSSAIKISKSKVVFCAAMLSRASETKAF